MEPDKLESKLFELFEQQVLPCSFHVPHLACHTMEHGFHRDMDLNV